MAQREPPFKGPWPVWTVAGTIIGSYALQSLLLSDQQALFFAEVPAEVARGFWAPLITALFIHGAWAHAGMNAVGALAFGAPASRYLGLGAKGGIGYILLFLSCGVVAGLGYAMLHPRDLVPTLGASGAVSGLLGASTRLIERRTELSPLATRTVVASTIAWIVINWGMGALHYSPGLGDVNLNWQAHIIGYFAGLLLIGPFAVVFREPPVLEDEPEAG